MNLEFMESFPRVRAVRAASIVFCISGIAFDVIVDAYVDSRVLASSSSLSM